MPPQIVGAVPSSAGKLSGSPLPQELTVCIPGGVGYAEYLFCLHGAIHLARLFRQIIAGSYRPPRPPYAYVYLAHDSGTAMTGVGDIAKTKVLAAVSALALIPGRHRKTGDVYGHPSAVYHLCALQAIDRDGENAIRGRFLLLK